MQLSRLFKLSLLPLRYFLSRRLHSSTAYFILFGLFISLVFVTVVYTLVSVFGNVGKALAIVMLVLQIALWWNLSSRVIAEVLPNNQPFLPFTYAIEMMREAVGGIIWSTVWMDLIFLFGFWFILSCSDSS